ncbi:MAG: hypothetical protein GXY15_04575 [Candidatus Hydrogenedentes bacterium]|nr:hypothetical protein [Candidatus Hydrogenedentota bacterium]
MVRRVFLGAVLAALGVYLAACAPCARGDERILIVGDSWAQGIWEGRVMEAALAGAGIPGVTSVGEKTALGGKRADQFATREYQRKILSELRHYPTVDSIHLIIGGNDILGRIKDRNVCTEWTEEQREKEWDSIAADVETIVRFCLEQPQVKHVVIGGYDYLNPDTAREVLALLGQSFTFDGMTQRQVNDCLIAVERRKMEMAKRIEGCEYVHNFGLAQHALNTPPGAPAPGGPPDYTPFPGGNPDYPMPDAAFDRVEFAGRTFAGDGIHPSAATHQRMLRNAIDQCYAKWYAPAPAAAETPAR